MTYEQIRDKVESDYIAVTQAKQYSARSAKLFYDNFSRALEELHSSVGPFIVSKEQFIEHIKYLKTQVSPGVYEAIVTYCRNSLRIKIE